MSAPNGTLGLPELSSTPSVPAPGTLLFFTKTDGNAYLLNSSGVLSAIGSTEAITSLTGDVSATGPGSAAATVNFVGGQSASNIAAAVVLVDGATSTSAPHTLVERDASSNFSANIITATLNGNAATSNSSLTAINFTGNLYGDVTGTQGATVIAMVGGETASNVALSVMATQAATPANTASTIVERDASGNFVASVITANLTGNVTGNLTGNVTGNVSGSSSTFTGSLSGDVTGTQSATAIASTVVTGKLLTGLATGTNTPILASNSILTAFENLQAQISGTSGSAITALTGDVSATGPGSVAATVNSVGGKTASQIASAVSAYQAATSADTPSTLALRDASGNISFSLASLSQLDVTGSANVVQATIQAWSTQTADVFDILNFGGSKLFSVTNAGNGLFAGTVIASNFSGSSSGTNTGDVTLTNTNSIDLAFTSGQTGLNATLNLSADAADAGYMLANTSIHSGANPGLLVEVAYGTPVNVGTSNYSGSAASFSLSDHVHAITSPIVLALLLTGYTTGSNTPITASNTFLQAFENLQAQISSSVGSAITSLTGDVTATGPGAAASTVVALQGHSVSNTAPTDAQMLLWVSGTSKWTPASMSGDATIADSGAITLSTTAVTGKLLTGYATGTNTPITASNSILTAFENLQAQVSATVGAAITSLTGDVTATGPGAAAATVAKIQGTTVSGTTGTGNVAFSASPTFTGTVTTAAISGTAITGTSFTDSSLTPGSIPFIGASGLITQDNANFFWNDSTIALGIGTNVPADVLNIVVSTASASRHVLLDGYGANAVGFRTRFAAGTIGSPSAVPSGAEMASFGAIGYGTSQFAAVNTGAIHIVAGETFTNASNATYMTFLTTATGSVAGVERMRINTNGNVMIGTTTDGGQLLQVNGTSAFNSSSVDAVTINSTSFVFDSVNNALGIGVQPNTATIITGINSSGAAKPIQLIGYGTGSSTGLRGDFARGTSGTPTAAQAGDTLNFISARGYGTSQFATSSTGVMQLVAGETFTNTSNATYIAFKTTPTGSVTSAERMRINSTGNILVGTTTDNGTDLVQVNGSLNTISHIISGTAGAGYINFTSQSAAPSTPSSGYRQYADSSGRFAWIGTNGFTRTFDGSANTANRVYTLPDTNGQIATSQMITAFKTAVVALTFGANVATDASTGNTFTLTLTGTANLSAPTNPTNGQKITYRISQDATGGRALTFDPIFNFGNSIYANTQTANKTDYIGCIYNSTNVTWDVVAFSKGF